MLIKYYLIRAISREFTRNAPLTDCESVEKNIKQMILDVNVAGLHFKKPCTQPIAINYPCGSLLESTSLTVLYVAKFKLNTKQPGGEFAAFRPRHINSKISRNSSIWTFQVQKHLKNKKLCIFTIYTCTAFLRLQLVGVQVFNKTS